MHRALLVCNSSYPEDHKALPELVGPRTDGLHLWAALTDERTGHFERPHVDVIFERTSKEILRRIESFIKESQRGDTILLYFSGHGRLDGKELFLCARDTETDRLLSTAVSSDLISKMIKNSGDVGSVVVILDCCHSGAFKGGGSIADSLKGAGRFILASTTDQQLTGDSQADGLPSPYTRVVIAGLLSDAEDVNGDGIIDLDDLHRFITLKDGKSQFHPTRTFDGSGEVAIARRQPPGSIEPPNPTEQFNGSRGEASDRTLSGLREGQSASNWWLHRRSRGDISVADTRLWVTFIGLGLISLSTAVAAALNWPRAFVWQSNYLQHPQIAWILAIAISGIVIMLSIIEWTLTPKLDARSAPRRIILVGNERPVLRLVRGLRDAVLLLSVSFYLPPLIFIENYSSSWIACLSAFGCAVLVLVVRRLNFGDAMFLGGIVLTGIGLILPDFSQHAIAQSSMVLPLAVLSLLAAGLWYVRAPRGAAISTCLLGILFSMLGWANTGFDSGEASLVTLFGFAVGTAAVGLGAAEQIADLA